MCVCMKNERKVGSLITSNCSNGSYTSLKQNIASTILGADHKELHCLTKSFSLGWQWGGGAGNFTSLYVYTNTNANPIILFVAYGRGGRGLKSLI